MSLEQAARYAIETLQEWGRRDDDKKCMEAIAILEKAIAQHANSGWQPIETAPRTKHGTPKRLMLLLDGVGPAFGFVYDDLCGGYFPVAEGYHGTWKINYWMPLPPLPEVKK